MELIADGLLIVGALAAAFYCWVLSVRVRGLKDLDKGVGAAIASLSEQVDEMQAALKSAQTTTGASVSDLQSTTKRAEKVARRLESFLDELDDLGLTGEDLKEKSAAKAKAAPAESAAADAASTVSKLADKRAQKQAKQGESDALSAAQKLQEDIKNRLAGRAEGSAEDEFVKALQTVLSAATK